MANIYTVDYSDKGVDPQNKQPITITPGSWDKSTSLILPGYSTALYGERIAENFVHLLENFASETQPDNPTLGQLWFVPSINALKVLIKITTVGQVKTYTWRVVGAISNTPSPPDDTSSLWYDTSNSNPALWQLKIYNTGTKSWLSVADRYILKAGDTVTGSITTTIANVGLTNGQTNATGFYPAVSSGPTFASAKSSTVLINTSGGSGAQFIVAQGQTLESAAVQANQLLTVAQSGTVTIYRGVLDMQNNKIVNVPNGTATNDAVNFGQLKGVETSLKNQLDSGLSDLEDRKVNRVGDTMTGALTINARAGAAAQGIGVFSLVVRATAQGQGGIVITTTDTGTTTNAINIVNPYGSGGALQSMFNVKAFTGDTAVAGTLQVSKSTVIHGSLTIGSISSMDVGVTAISLPRHLVTKEYVDMKVGSVVPTEQYARVNPASPRNGDILISGGNNYIYNAGWKQVYPAQWAN